MGKTLYFINGPAPSEKEQAEAESLGAYFRNALLAGSTDIVEQCDAVAGAVPGAYEKFPRAGVKVAKDKKDGKADS